MGTTRTDDDGRCVRAVDWRERRSDHPGPEYVIQHPRGLVLFDTGLAPEAIDDPKSYYPAIAGFVTIEMDEQHLLVNQLDAIGFSPGDVTYVPCSHAYFDHTGGLHLSPHAKFHIGAGELQHALRPSAMEVVAFRREDLKRTRAFG